MNNKRGSTEVNLQQLATVTWGNFHITNLSKWRGNLSHTIDQTHLITWACHCKLSVCTTVIWKVSNQISIKANVSIFKQLSSYLKSLMVQDNDVWVLVKRFSNYYLCIFNKLMTENWCLLSICDVPDLIWS